MAQQTNRLISLDALRGFTIAAMITVNFPGIGEHVYAPLNHSVWNGLTPTDLIAPFFLFIVGVSIAFAYTKRREAGTPKGGMYKKIIVRTLKIFIIGLFLNLLPDFNFAELRYTGTLARISFVFIFCAFLFLNTKWKTQAWVGVGILVAYWLAMTLIPTPGYGKVMLERGANLAAWVDEMYMPGVKWQGNWDPEGILSTFPSFVTGITGMLAGHLLLHKTLSKHEKSIYLMVGGLFVAALGYVWGLTFPVNENIWTSSFVLVTSGMASMLLGAVYFLVDIQGRTKGTKPGIIFGANAITVYVLADFFGLFFYSLKFGSFSLSEHFFNAFTSIGLAPKFVSMVYAILFICLNFIPAYILYKKKIFIKL
jgi:predicted acyltransferase